MFDISGANDIKQGVMFGISKANDIKQGVMFGISEANDIKQGGVFAILNPLYDSEVKIGRGFAAIPDPKLMFRHLRQGDRLSI